MDSSMLPEEVHNPEMTIGTHPAVEIAETDNHTEDGDTPTASETNQQTNSKDLVEQDEEEENKVNKVKVHVQINQNPPQIGKTSQNQTEIEENEPVNQNKINTERLIAELCLRCPDEQIRKHLQLYEYGRGTDYIRKKLGAVTNEHLTNLLVFLYNDKVKHRIPTLKKNLVHDIIGRIQNLLPDICAFCNTEYKVDFDEEPIMPCAHCYQSSHKDCVVKLINTKLFNDPVEHPTETQVKALINPYNIPGVHYLCKACDTKIIQNIAKKEISKINTTLEDPNEIIEVISVSKDNDTENNTQISKETNNTSNTDQDKIFVSNFRSRLKQKEINDSHPIQSSTQNNTKTKPQKSQQKADTDTNNKKNVCKFYEKGSCTHGPSGDNCNYAHPEICRKYTQHGSRQPKGCNRGKKCKYLHPVMCIYSMRKGECMNSRCSFRHILGTKRPPPNATINNDSKGARITENESRPNIDIKENNNNNNTNALPDHFLAMIRLVKAEFLKEMDAKLEKMSSQMNQNLLSSTPQHPQSILPRDTQTICPPQMQQSQMSTHPTHPGHLHNHQHSLVPLPPQTFRESQEASQPITHPQMMQVNQHNSQNPPGCNSTNQAQTPTQYDQQTGRTMIIPNTMPYSQVAALQIQQPQQINQRMQNHRQLIPPSINQNY